MKALVTRAPREMTFEEQAKSEPGPGEVQVQSRVVGICGSDIHLYTGTHPYRTYPNVFGHEVSGWVTRVGQGVLSVQHRSHKLLQPDAHDRRNRARGYG
jgi:D-arabinose 1-dehydrogenase-like Zn-dependent alcohol dehydrogenase